MHISNRKPGYITRLRAGRDERTRHPLDMPTLRGWWREDAQATAHFAWQMLGEAFPPLELTTELATRIIRQHLESSAM